MTDFPQRLPTERLARRYLALVLLERELAEFDETRTAPEWAPLRQSIEETIGFLNVTIERGEDYLATQLQPKSEQPPAPPDAAAQGEN